MAEDTLSFVDVRFIAYNKNPDNNNHTVTITASHAMCLIIASQPTSDPPTSLAGYTTQNTTYHTTHSTAHHTLAS
jgi:hypothetical protein